MSKIFKNKPYKQEESSYEYQDSSLDCAIEEAIEKEEPSIEHERRIRMHKQKMFMCLGDDIQKLSKKLKIFHEIIIELYSTYTSATIYFGEITELHAHWSDYHNKYLITIISKHSGGAEKSSTIKSFDSSTDALEYINEECAKYLAQR